MTFTEYWSALVKRNPDMADESTRMTIGVESFKRSLEQAFEMGQKQARESNRAMEKLFGGKGSNPFGF